MDGFLIGWTTHNTAQHVGTPELSMVPLHEHGIKTKNNGCVSILEPIEPFNDVEQAVRTDKDRVGAFKYSYVLL